MGKKNSKKQKKQPVAKGKMFWGILIMISLIAVGVFWASSSRADDMVESNDDTIVQEGTVVENLEDCSFEAVDWFDGDWVSLEVLNADGTDATEEGVDVFGISTMEFVYLWIRYQSDETGSIVFSLPEDREDVKNVMDGEMQKGINAWVTQINRRDWEVIEEMHGTNRIALNLLFEESGTERQVLITMP